MPKIITEKYDYRIDCTEEEINKALDTDDQWMKITTVNENTFIINKNKIERIQL